MKLVAKILAVLAAALVAIQFVPVRPTNPPVTSPWTLEGPAKEVLVRACFDCHSHETRLPWYGKLAPASWLLAYDMKEGRAHLNFSAWAEWPAEKQKRRIHEIGEEVQEGEMPPALYTFMHPKAKLSPGDKATLAAWVLSQTQGSPKK
ncbi:MAG: heme-binding domain-containing protein [Spirochaetes bacterium]|nr:heme-binding domain-containing protein [Spirochaetota bacterium]